MKTSSAPKNSQDAEATSENTSSTASFVIPTPAILSPDAPVPDILYVLIKTGNGVKKFELDAGGSSVS